MIVSVIILIICLIINVIWCIRSFEMLKQGYVNCNADMVAVAMIKTLKIGFLNVLYGVLGLLHMIAIPGGFITALIFTVIGGISSLLFIEATIMRKRR